MLFPLFFIYNTATTQLLYSLYIFFIVWEDSNKWKWFSWVSTDLPLIYSSNGSSLQKLRMMSFYFYPLQTFVLEQKLVMSLKLSLSNFSSFRFCIWSGFYFNLPSDFICNYFMQTGKTKWSSVTVVETVLNMIMNYEGESDYLILEVRNTKAVRGWRMSLTFFFRELCMCFCWITTCYSWASVMIGVKGWETAISASHIYTIYTWFVLVRQFAF